MITGNELVELLKEYDSKSGLLRQFSRDEPHIAELRKLVKNLNMKSTPLNADALCQLATIVLQKNDWAGEKASSQTFIKLRELMGGTCVYNGIKQLQADKMLEGLHVQFLMEYPSKALELAQLMPIIGMLSIDKYMQIEKITTEEVACFTKLSQAGIPLVEQLLLLVHHLENPTTLTDALILLKMKQLYEVIEKKFDLGYKTMTKISACILILEQVSPDFITERNISIILRCKNITGILEALLPFDKNCLPPEPFCAKPRNIFGWRVPTAGERKYEALKRFLEKLSKMDESTVDEEVTTLLQPNPTANLESYSDEEDGVQGACRLI